MKEGVEMAYWIVFLLMKAGIHVGLWKLFVKAGHPGWASLIPIYNYYISLKIIGKSMRWMAYLAIPIVNLVMPIVIVVELCKSFNRLKLRDQTLCMLFPYAYLPYMGFKRSIVYEGHSHEVNRRQPKKRWRDWADAAVFALVAASFIRTFFIEAYAIPTSSMERTMLVGDRLFVSKFHYGARFPMTPVAIPLVHNQIPVIGGKSYLGALQLPYFRFPAINSIERNDVVVFNYPAGDTIIAGLPTQTYYQAVRGQARATYGAQPDFEERRTHYQRLAAEQIKNARPIVTQPVDKRENYVKRCVAIPGDKLEIRHGVLMINDEEAWRPPHHMKSYILLSDFELNDRFRIRYNIYSQDMRPESTGHAKKTYVAHLTEEARDAILASGQIDSVIPITHHVPSIPQDPRERNYVMGQLESLFPGNPDLFKGTLDNFGPVVMPAKGATIDLTPENIELYRRVIETHEGHTLRRLENGQVSIDGEVVDQYTFEMNYYFMIGDNRHNSLDSRYWGFVPEDHIVGKPLFVWLSMDEYGSIRFDRFLKMVR